MPKVRRKNVPRVAFEHRALRVRERAVPIEDLQNLTKWIDTDPRPRWDVGATSEEPTLRLGCRLPEVQEGNTPYPTVAP